ncbi:hypothetical protein [Deinococcus sp. DB0503]|uniref:hypothetical protein n=1 Tax=Deinococcus sp. DB0503 TaxID=2479203 RepID=UPI0018E036F9|nr:hypothetical protein [Deinococcus sp. DB0503]
MTHLAAPTPQITTRRDPQARARTDALVRKALGLPAPTPLTPTAPEARDEQAQAARPA